MRPRVTSRCSPRRRDRYRKEALSTSRGSLRQQSRVERAMHLERVERAGAMAQHVLLLQRQLGEDPAIRQLKDWIEAEAAGAARLGGDGSAQDAFAFEAPAIRQGKHRDAMEGRRRRLVRCRPDRKSTRLNSSHVEISYAV